MSAVTFFDHGDSRLISCRKIKFCMVLSGVMLGISTTQKSLGCILRYYSYIYSQRTCTSPSSKGEWSFWYLVSNSIQFKKKLLMYCKPSFAVHKYPKYSILTTIFNSTQNFAMSSDSTNKQELESNQNLKAVSIFDPINQLEIEVLSAISKQERYGLEIVKAFEEASANKKTIKLSTLYTLLSRLENRELIISRVEEERTAKKGGGNRKYFQITDKGLSLLLQQEAFYVRVANCKIQTI
jgi:DNA-binding PadR family transcriptional regulator